MSGIAGYIDMRTSIKPDLLVRMNNVARYRGPDDEGYAFIGFDSIMCAGGEDTIAELNVSNGIPSVLGIDSLNSFLGLAHRRSSVIDLSQEGHQPMVIDKERLCVTFSGEIYNYPELREELISLGHIFYANNDTEMLLHAYLQWGDDCVTHFNGAWAFILWDGRSTRILCSRDRLGQKTLQYYANNSLMVFGSESKQVLEHPAVPHVMNETVLATELIYGISHYDNQTLLTDIYSLKAGHNLIVEVDPVAHRIKRIEEKAYWILPTASRNMDSNDEYVKWIGQAFSKSVMLRLRSDVTVTAMLSGGLDSSSLVTEVCAQLAAQGVDPATFLTFTAGFPNTPNVDESHFAQILAQHTGCSQLFVPVDEKSIWREYEKLIWHIEDIVSFAVLNSWNVHAYMSRHGYKVALSGQAGDETLFGYERYYAFLLRDLLKKGRLWQAFNLWVQASQHSKLTLKQLAQYVVWFSLPFVRISNKKLRAKKFYTKNIISAASYAHVKQLLFAKNLQQQQHLELTSTQLPRILHWEDRVPMAHGISTRFPFADHEFVARAVATPARNHIKDGYTKSIMREYMTGKMPDEVVWRTNKMGFESPHKQWAHHIDSEWLLSLLNEPRGERYFRLDALYVDGKPDVQKMLNSGFVATELFMRLFDVHTPE